MSILGFYQNVQIYMSEESFQCTSLSCGFYNEPLKIVST